MKLTTHRITEDDEDTLDIQWEQERIDNLPLSQQRLAIAHHLDQWQAEPSIVEHNTQELQRRSLRQS